jgi:hypothetical protein
MIQVNYIHIKPELIHFIGYVVPRRGFPASSVDISDGDVNINARLRNKYHMNLIESVGFFGESSSKIINTAMLGELKLEIIFTSQIASCILGSSVPAATPIHRMYLRLIWQLILQIFRQMHYQQRLNYLEELISKDLLPILQLETVEFQRVEILILLLTLFKQVQPLQQKHRYII